MENLMEQIDKVIDYAAYGFEVIGAALVVWGGLEALIFIIRHVLRHKTHERLEKIVCTLGHKMLVSLDFFLAGDLLSTIVSPTWDALGKLGALIVIRTALSYFITLEIKNAKKEIGD